MLLLCFLLGACDTSRFFCSIQRASEWDRGITVVGMASHAQVHLEENLHCAVDALSGRRAANNLGSDGSSPAEALGLLQRASEKGSSEKTAGAVENEELVRKVAGERAEDIERVNIQALSKMELCHLQDFDWSVRIVVGSDKLSGQRQPVAVLRLCLGNVHDGGEGGGNEEEVLIELTASDLDDMIATFDKIQKAVGKIKEY